MADANPAQQARQAALGRLRLRHLQCLLAVSEGGNLRRAAESLAISQPAVTKTLNELEDILGVRLFVRGRRGAVPTPEAAVFLRHARASVAALGDAVDSVLQAAAEPPLRIGALPTLAPSVLPRILAAWRAQRPRAALRVITGLNGDLLRALRARELDAVLGRLAEPADMPGVSFEMLYAEPLAAVVRPGHALLAEASPSAAAIAAQPLVLPLDGTLIRHAADSFLTTRGAAPQAGVTETVSSSLARALVRQADAVWFAPWSAVEADVAAGLLARLPIDTTGTEEPVGLLLHADAVPSPDLQAFATAARAVAAARRALA